MLAEWIFPRSPIAAVTDQGQRRAISVEIIIVFVVTLGLSGFRSVLSLVDSILRPTPLNQQTVAINAPQARASVLDLLGQLASIGQLLGWAALGCLLLWHSGIRPAAIGLRTPRCRDWLHGVALAALIGVPGLLFYLAARAVGANLDVAPSALDDTWWRIPILLMSAVANALAEEILVVGYLITRLRQRGRSENVSLLCAALLRGSYHLYQGFGGFVGNVVMGLVFGRLWQCTGRLVPLIVAHTVLDVVSFVGYAVLKDHLAFL